MRPASIPLIDPKTLAAILTGAQHEKDGKGLNVTNGYGEGWRAFGDGHFFTAPNEENRQRVIAATQLSVDEIYDAFQDPPQSQTVA